MHVVEESGMPLIPTWNAKYRTARKHFALESLEITVIGIAEPLQTKLQHTTTPSKWVAWNFAANVAVVTNPQLIAFYL